MFLQGGGIVRPRYHMQYVQAYNRVKKKNTLTLGS